MTDGGAAVSAGAGAGTGAGAGARAGAGVPIGGAPVTAGGWPAAPDGAASYDVVTASGTLRGSIEGELVRFRGVRYATAERFEAPVAAPEWTGIREARADGPMCPQPPFGLALLALPKGTPPMAEDCLFLNITIPRAALGEGAPLRPVMVWIHGGAYVNGSGAGEIYDPARLVADGDVIVVGLNYRLGVFGYVPLAPGEPEAGDAVPANLGVLDQLAALAWVKQNIAAFGGDPSTVTLFGQSAGADAIAQLLAIPEADGLFSRAILQSPPLGLDTAREVLAVELGANVVRALGQVHPRDASVQQLLEAQVRAGEGLHGDRLTGGMPYAPTPGVWPVPAKAERAERWARRAPAVDVLIGYNRDDFSAFLEVVGALRRARASRLLRPATEPLSAALTRRVFGAPSLALAGAFAAAGARVFTYRLDWRPMGTPWGACHCLELPFFWADEEFWRGSPMLGGAVWADLEKTGLQLRRSWAAFARTGTPTPIGDPGHPEAEWPPYSSRRRVGSAITLHPRYTV
ncbi:carboxylesterase family protein [Subtercola sp. RTI3]|uniref:carboxylesterase family protein n=1 Tax=Subtercola sp. RTI3 TaxID=3048639 RepID=UPI002B2357C4|nr:carboxylesterase family protein [Subtercola sp. RTI3]